MSIKQSPDLAYVQRPTGMPPLASAGQRVSARLIDTVLLGVIWTAALVLTGALRYSMDHPGKQDSGKILFAALVTFALYFLYEGLMLAHSGQTLGKKALRIRVAVLADGNVPAARGWARAALYVLPGLLTPVFLGTLFWLLNSLWFLWDKPFRQCLHDKAAKTVVVEAY
ncbi:RDD family protein [Streptomyces sp. H27-D2]|uniref:RDD family protein n=1 Tax=Streptomyces sp. H27-D2 TaxID=3046304 RepID=UPI002DBFE2CB|nr:RDD family protein [Streptomyces sp. H27-D2]MEC4015123.1 RDD family protein [Streptomyces sp. H27-D2]